jgi:hypothetical protein
MNTVRGADQSVDADWADAPNGIAIVIRSDAAAITAAISARIEPFRVVLCTIPAGDANAGYETATCPLTPDLPFLLTFMSRFVRSPAPWPDGAFLIGSRA